MRKSNCVPLGQALDEMILADQARAESVCRYLCMTWLSCTLSSVSSLLGFWSYSVCNSAHTGPIRQDFCSENRNIGKQTFLPVAFASGKPLKRGTVVIISGHNYVVVFYQIFTLSRIRFLGHV